MNLLITFLIAIAVNLSLITWMAVLIDHMTTPFVSLLVFFPLLFLTIYATWKLSVRLTEPKAELTETKARLAA